VSAQSSPGAEQVGSAELVAALCLATDLGMGFPFEHGLHSTLIATRLAERLGVGSATASQTYYACLLSHAGCTADAHVTAEVFGDSLTTHLHPVIRGSGREVFSGLIPRTAGARQSRRPCALSRSRGGCDRAQQRLMVRRDRDAASLARELPGGDERDSSSPGLEPRSREGSLFGRPSQRT
jgi:hypothetical protein